MNRRARLVSISVKSKQRRVWFNCKGVSGDRILILVDFQGKELTERPDFYILTAKDWTEVVYRRHGDKIKSGEIIMEDNCPVWPKQGGYRGHSAPVSDVAEFKEIWEKILG